MHPAVRALFQDQDAGTGEPVLCVVESFHDLVLRVRHVPLAASIDVFTGPLPATCGLHRIGQLSVLIRQVPARRARLPKVQRTIDLFRVVAILLGIAFGGYSIAAPPRPLVELLEIPDRCGGHFLLWEPGPRRRAEQRIGLGAVSAAPHRATVLDEGGSDPSTRAPDGPGPTRDHAVTWQGAGPLDLPQSFDDRGLARVVEGLQAGDRPSARVEDLVNGLGLPGRGVHSAHHPQHPGRLVVRVASDGRARIELDGVERVRLLGHTSGWAPSGAPERTQPMTWVLLVDPDGVATVDGVPLEPTAWRDAPRSLRAAFVAAQLGEWLQGADVHEAWLRHEAERVLDARRPGEALLLNGVRAAWSGS